MTSSKLYLLFSLILATLVLGNAQSQFRLNPSNDASECYMICHTQSLEVIDLPGHEGEPGAQGNSFYAIGANCKLDFITSCLPAMCRSPPDLAYAMEYGHSLCRRAGIKFNIELPKAYLESQDGKYFSSDLYLTSDAESTKITSTVQVGIAIGMGIGIAALQSRW